ncbi:putative ribonuclease H-like domain-containing protein [Tanacetum coccineum]|uniref:Ribonuclease H-like domain-containing protein n=1 Tax=Tanacetum coccineum TaxID=301880 RepID=A0ABQ5HQD7_9ASTR
MVESMFSKFKEDKVRMLLVQDHRGIALGSRGNTSGQAKVVKCYNCQGEGHMARQCTQPKRRRDATWFKEKVLLVQAQAEAFQTDDLDTYDSDCDDISSAKAILMANLSSCNSDVLSEVPYSNNSHNDVMNQGVQELQYSDQSPIFDYLDNEITSDSNIIPYSQYLEEIQHTIVQNTNTSAQQNSMILSIFEQMSNHATNWDNANNESKIVNESLTAELERYKEQVKILEQIFNVDLSSREKFIDSQMDDMIRMKNTKFPAFEAKIDTLKQTLSKHVKEKESLLTTLNGFKTEFKQREYKSIDKEIVLENKNKELENIVFAMQLNKEIFQQDKTCDNQNNPEIQEYFEQNDLKAQLQAKDTVISKLNETIHSMRENVNPAKVKQDIDENETINIELEHSVAKLLSENEKLHIEKEYLKKTYKEIYDSIKPTRVHAKEHCEDLIANLNAKSMENADLKAQIQEKPTGNTKNNRISQSLSSNNTNKVEDQSRSVKYRKKKKNCVVKTECNAYVMQSMLNANSKSTCAICNECLFDANHDQCVLDYVHDVNVLSKTKRAKRKNRKQIWKPTDCPNCSVDVGISHETSVVRTPQQNDIVERQNRTLVDVARTMLIYTNTPLFLWAEAIAMTCYTQNRSLICFCHGKTPYELLHDRNPNLSYLYEFGALCYPINDSEDLGKLKAKVDVGIVIGYAPAKKTYRIYNRHTRRIMETIHVDFNDLTGMASEQSSLGPTLNEMTPGTLSSGLVPQPPSSTPFVLPTRNDWDTLLQSLFDEYFHPLPCVDHPVSEVAAPVLDVSTGTPSSTSVDQDAPSQSTSQTPPELLSQVIPPGAKEADHDIEVAHIDNNPYVGFPIPEPNHPIDNVIGDPSRPVSIRHQLQTEALFCYFNAFLSSVEPKSYKEALTEYCWIEAMQEELNKFERLEVWELVPRPDRVMIITLKWIYKVKLDELRGILKNKARLVARGYRQEKGIDLEESFTLVD